MLLLATIMAFFALVMRIVAIEFRLSTLEAFFRKIVVNNSQPTPPKTEPSGPFPPVAEEAHSDVSADDLSDVGDEVKVKGNSGPSAARRDIERAFSDDTPPSDEEGPPAAPEAQTTRTSSRRRTP